MNIGHVVSDIMERCDNAYIGWEIDCTMGYTPPAPKYIEIATETCLSHGLELSSLKRQLLERVCPKWLDQNVPYLFPYIWEV